MRGTRRSILANPPSPPPSPIPTGKGSRSAANDRFARFLDRSLRVPALSLPGCHGACPAKADLPSLLPAGKGLDRVLGSGRDFGVFRITGHGVSAEELAGLVRECEDCGADWGGVSDGLGERMRCWVGSGRRDGGDGLSENMKIIASKLEAIAEQLSEIILENARKQSNHKRKLSGKRESVLSLYRFNHKNSIDKNQLPLNESMCDRISLSLHIPFEHCQIYVQSEEDHFSFDADPETLVVTIGKQIEEWSDQEFKCVTGKMIFVAAPDIRAARDYSLSVELKLASSNSSNSLNRNHNTIISIFDQVVFALVVTLLYKVCIFSTSCVVFPMACFYPFFVGIVILTGLFISFVSQDFIQWSNLKHSLSLA